MRIHYWISGDDGGTLSYSPSVCQTRSKVVHRCFKLKVCKAFPPECVKEKRRCDFSASTPGPRSDMFIAGICNSAVEGMKYGMCAVVPHPAQPLSTIGRHAALRQENFATASTTNLNHV